jgi:hypothetical protein
MQTVNRGSLMKKVAAGLVEAKCNFSLTDDYRLDDQNEFGVTGWMPARLSSGYGDFVQGQMNLKQHDFTSKSGRAYKNDDGTITLIVHSNECYTLRIKEA